ncbi:hypothetical protein BDN67DRAFT_990071 [Paxillus ammoniavirescens]|nr:hypothetical protein BDN67DRAFT_990071 [Paxillus ammoniavirescens]
MEDQDLEDFPTLSEVKVAIAILSGVEPIINNMCPKSCIGYPGPFSRLEHCPECGVSRYDIDILKESGNTIKTPCLQFATIPIGPQLQALFRDLNSATPVFNDIFNGTDYLEAVQDGMIKDEDICLLFSIDGAQLYHHKASDCWISIWVVLNRSPESRYRKQFVLPGLPIWDASLVRQYLTNLFIAIATSDGPGLAYLDRLVGHHGKNRCRLYCGLPGRHKEGGSIYYPVTLKPDGPPIQGSDHPDLDPDEFCCSINTYVANLAKVLSSPNDAQYKKSIFLGFPHGRTFGVPKCFGSDVMHLLSLNLPDLLISLWRGMLDCDSNDDKTTWLWACLTKPDEWKAHGVYGRPPCNPAEKINSGYKAWEFHLYLYGLGPGLLHGILPDPYWRNFCRLACAVRLITQHSITREELKTANQLFIKFASKFKELYYQRRIEHVHFVRQSIHTLTHYGREVETKGPLSVLRNGPWNEQLVT